MNLYQAVSGSFISFCLKFSPPSEVCQFIISDAFVLLYGSLHLWLLPRYRSPVECFRVSSFDLNADLIHKIRVCLVHKEANWSTCSSPQNYLNCFSDWTNSSSFIIRNPIFHCVTVCFRSLIELKLIMTNPLLLNFNFVFEKLSYI